MSFDADLRSLIKKVDASLQDLRELLQESTPEVQEARLLSNHEEQGVTPHPEMMEATERASRFLREMETACSDNQRRLNQLEDELKIQIESLERNAANHFTKGEYQECLGTVTFLSALKPNDPRLQNYQELCRKMLEKATGTTVAETVVQDPIELDANGLEYPLAAEMSVDSKPTGFAGEAPALSPIACNLGKNISLNSESLMVVPRQLPLPATNMDQGRFFLQLMLPFHIYWPKEVIALFVIASLLFGLAIGTRAVFTTHESLSRNADPYGAGVSQNDSEKALLSMTSLQAESHGVSNGKDFSGPEDQSPVAVKPMDQIGSLETAQALFEIGRLKEADASCKAILKRNPRNKFALRIRRSVRDYYFIQARKSRLKATSGTSRDSLNHLAQTRFFRFEQTLPQQVHHSPGVTTTNSTAAAHGEAARALEDAAVARQSTAILWVQKAKSAMLSGRYLTPPQDNVLVYCRRALVIDPRNAEALALKRESFVKALSQANEWISKGEYEEALHLYSSLCYLSQLETGSPYSVQDLQQELEKLEFKAYPVVHQHMMGSCTGRLRLNGHVVSFVPSGPSDDGFIEKLANISVTVHGDRLNMKVGFKSYRFRANFGKSEEESRESLEAIYKQLTVPTAQASR
jgi:hypothetical protein